MGLGIAATPATAQHPRAAERDAMVNLIERMGVRDSTTLAATSVTRIV